MHVVIIFFSLLLFSSLNASQHETDVYYRDLYCDPKTELKELPQSFLEVCKKAGVDPNSIHVYKTKSGQLLHSIGRNIMFRESFFAESSWYKTDKEKAWGFAHELSHVIHDDTSSRLWSYQFALYDFQIFLSLAAAVHILHRVYKQRISVPSFMRTGGLYLLANIGALYTYFQAVQAFELRANDEACQYASAQAGISVLEKLQWAHENTNTLKGRLNNYKDKLGFCDHGSHALQLARLKKWQKEHAVKS